MQRWGGGAATIATSFDRRQNSLNAIRLALAATVLVSHSWAVGGFGAEPVIGGLQVGGWAVLGFFAISGFLITASRIASTPARFYRARALRILPGLLVCLVVVAFVLAPISTLFDGRWSPASAATYVLRNTLLYPPHFAQEGVVGTIESSPYSRLWNGSLWTLFWEACCYVGIGIAVSVVPRRWILRIALIVTTGAVAVSTAAAVGLGLPDMVLRVLPLATAFCAGSVLHLAGEWIPVNPLAGLIAIGWLVVAVMLSQVALLGVVPFAFLLLVIGGRTELAAFGRRHDLSYGFYIYAWPVQQIGVLLLQGAGGVGLLIVVSITLVVPLAFLSWSFVERPALRLAGARPRSLPVLPATTPST